MGHTRQLDHRARRSQHRSPGTAPRCCVKKSAKFHISRKTSDLQVAAPGHCHKRRNRPVRRNPAPAQPSSRRNMIVPEYCCISQVHSHCSCSLREDAVLGQARSRRRCLTSDRRLTTCLEDIRCCNLLPLPLSPPRHCRRCTHCYLVDLDTCQQCTTRKAPLDRLRLGKCQVHRQHSLTGLRSVGTGQLHTVCTHSVRSSAARNLGCIASKKRDHL